MKSLQIISIFWYRAIVLIFIFRLQLPNDTDKNICFMIAIVISAISVAYDLKESFKES